ncbi:MAG: dephospho-CoA kinase [Anaerolineae bacterium]|nr:dephospho-CoA kinase [Anaerolineae bacterium]
MSNRPYVIGLTGNIATGKSTVGQLLAGLGAQHVDADRLTHQVMAHGAPAWHKIVEAFGGAVLALDGEIDRRRLGTIVFANPDALARLEAIVHPEVIALIRQIITQAQAPVVVLEAIKLIESGIAVQLCDAVWVVTAPRAVQVQRLMEQRHQSEQDAALRVDVQEAQEAKIARADVVIDNRGDMQDTIRQVQEAWAQIGPEICRSQPKGES